MYGHVISRQTVRCRCSPGNFFCSYQPPRTPNIFRGKNLFGHLRSSILPPNERRVFWLVRSSMPMQHEWMARCYGVMSRRRFFFSADFFQHQRFRCPTCEFMIGMRNINDIFDWDAKRLPGCKKIIITRDVFLNTFFWHPAIPLHKPHISHERLHRGTRIPKSDISLNQLVPSPSQDSQANHIE